MRRTAWWVLLIFLSLTPRVVWAEASVLDRVLAKGVLRVGSTGDYPPFSLLDERTQQWRGIDIERANSLARSLGVRVEFVKTTWGALVDDLKNNRFDIAIGGISVTLARQRVGLFSIPYMDDGKVLVVRIINAKRLNSLAAVDQVTLRIIVNPGGTNEQFVRENIHQARIVVWPENRTIFAELIAGRADALITNRSEALYQCRLHPDLQVVGPLLTRAEKACFLPRDLVWKAYVDQWMRMTLREAGGEAPPSP